MTIRDIRSKYLAFMQAHGHEVIPSSSLVPLNDPTTLFTGSGMQQLMPYLLGESHPKGTRLADSQKSFRAEDIDEIGDNRHTTFFEMLGNWSLGDYFKEEQLSWISGFLMDELGIDPSRLYVTVFNGDEGSGIPRDEESAAIWERLFAARGIEAAAVVMGSEVDGSRLGMREGRIFYYDVTKNWWSRAGVPSKMPSGEPGGPDSEIFFDFQTPHDPKFGAECHPNCDCGRFMEIGNSVFMQYLKKGERFERLPKQNVDFGGGLERIAAAVAGTPDVFAAVDVLQDIIALLERFSKKSYDDSRYTRSFRIVADHIRAAVFMLGDGVRPSNTAQGYILRRLLRRAALHAQKLEVEQDQADESMLNRAATIVVEAYADAYPELATEEMHREIADAIWKEELQFAKTLESGMKEFGKSASTGSITGEAAFVLFTTHGFPFELTQELAKERGIPVDAEDFHARMKEHQDLSRAGSEQKFKGGLADASEETARLHTAHHLLLRALQIVLGDHVKQRGSNITKERLRIDFSHDTKMTPAQKAAVERIVNEKIAEDLPVIRSILPKEEAEKLNAEHEFGAKYPDMVSVYSMGPQGATRENPRFPEAYSIEFCGGPHVAHTGELSQSGTFRITAEEASSAGVRRIKAVLK